jgi:hypothetical protein
MGNRDRGPFRPRRSEAHGNAETELEELRITFRAL